MKNFQGEIVQVGEKRRMNEGVGKRRSKWNIFQRNLAQKRCMLVIRMTKVNDGSIQFTY